MALFKLPFILTSTIALHAMSTSPTQSRHSGQQDRLSYVERVLPYLIAYLTKGGFWVWALLETAVIVSHSLPKRPLSAHVLATLTSPTKSCNIHLTPLFFFGWFLTISGTLVRLQCYRLLGPLFTYDIGIQENHKLITSGPYAYVRHPSYISAGSAALGALMCYSMPGSWVYECTKADALVDTLVWVWLVVSVIVATMLVRRARTEDEMLKQRFGKEWEEWARRVPASFIPGIY